MKQTNICRLSGDIITRDFVLDLKLRSHCSRTEIENKCLETRFTRHKY